ncbi:peptide/nickel transport system ATP-binding protein [Streptosporangium becharense]|uniref:Nickel import system ATP-binding protein NikD n=1 Tax=Streptosporangium becharense TaxID=1816182 RepID=A0A7W9IMZ8_9ACTN|nr:ATP-binding cassette domain-containing protein [Streptosporangium becharense]MBB2915389.1 peptide/nickel transport system ATP-binding protein [Streptosporangium becharense]MBB5823725.1 peptide/nickel transport system ATP-binding protein [Streptosporangium becharense]
MSTPILTVSELNVSFIQYASRLRTRTVTGVADLDLEVREGEVLAVIGASGSGKTLLAQAILGILPRNADVTGEIRFRGERLTAARRRRTLGREISYIPQSVMNLDPLMPVGKQVRIGLDPKTARQEQRRLFARYDLASEVAGLYPFELSGGMLRRVLFATSVRDTVRLLIADEPTPGLHAEAVEEVLRHLRELAAAGVAVLLITHDILSAVSVAERVAVMNGGRLVTVESASAFTGEGDRLSHPFARDLWRALPQNRFSVGGVDWHW